MLKIEIVSSRVVEGTEDKGKKYVAYMVQVRPDGQDSVLDIVNVERRYTHFLDLYNGLKKEQPTMLQDINFPRKAMVGNFDPSLISTRCAAFESVLKMLTHDSRLRDTLASMAFFQDPELIQAKKLISLQNFSEAIYVLETSFKLLNKVYTDRSRVVLSTLCRLVACADGRSELAVQVEKWAQLALKRYEGVSDSDLLMVYIPLLHTCLSIWDTLGRDKTKLEEELSDLKKRGMKVDPASLPTLMEAVDGFTTGF